MSHDLRLDADSVFSHFWATALEDAQHRENDEALEEGREPLEITGDPVNGYAESYKAAVVAICRAAEKLMEGQNPNTFPRVCPEGDLDAIFGSDLFMTCMGRGVGFWDGDWNPIGDELTDLCHESPFANCGGLTGHADGGYFIG